MLSSTVNQIIDLFRAAFRGIGANVPMPEIERLGIVVHRSMGNPRRVYHSTQHVIDVASGAPPLRTFAALFHDIVYYQLDGGFPAEFAPMLERAIAAEDGKFRFNAAGLDSPGARLCAGVFGFSAGDEVPLASGLNEFASALVAVSVLGRHLAPVQMLAVLACIEATIPFRCCGEDGSAAARLRQHLAQVASRHDLRVEAQQLDDMVRESVNMANRDVQGFAEPDPGVFLANTWRLIEESNAELSAASVYSIRQYRQALARMEGFISQLDHRRVFQNYTGLLSSDEFAALRQAAAANLRVSRRYLAAKLVAIAIVEALAEATGGDCPVAMLLGDIGDGLRAERLLPAAVEAHDCDPELLDILRNGRSGNSSYDPSNSPLSAFVYCRVGETGLMQCFERAKAMFAGTLAPAEYLRETDGETVASLALACAAIAPSRRDGLQAQARCYAP